MCGGNESRQPLYQQRPSPSYAKFFIPSSKVAGGNSARAPTSTLEHCLRSKGVEEAWQLLEVLLQGDGALLADSTKGLVAADKYTISQMLAKTTSDSGNQNGIQRAIILTKAFIEWWPSDVDEGLFNALLDACCQLKDVSQLQSTMDQMERLQVEPSAVTLGILVKTYGRAGQIDKVMDVWNKMLPQRQQANAVTYGCMLDSCVKCGDLKRALQVFEDVKSEGKHRNTVLYTTLIKGCSKQKNLQSALALFREMKAESVPYNTITYNSIIDVCIICGAIHLAEGIFQQMIYEESESQGSSPDLITFSTLLKGYCQAGQLDKAFMVLEAIRERGLPCDELVYNTLIDGCVKANDLTTGLGLFEEMLREGARPSPITHSILVKLYKCSGYGQQSPEAVAVLYQHHGLQPPVVGGRRRRHTGRAETQKGLSLSPNNVLVHRKESDFSGTASSHCSSPGSMASIPQAGVSWDQGHTLPMNFTESQAAPMSTFAHHTLSGGCGNPDSTYGSVGCYATSQSSAEVQSYIQNIPMPQGGSLLIMGPYPAPANNVGTQTPADFTSCNRKTKAIIKI